MPAAANPEIGIENGDPLMVVKAPVEELMLKAATPATPEESVT